MRKAVLALTTALFLGSPMATLGSSPFPDTFVPMGEPLATIELTSEEGTALVEGEWRYHDVEIVDVGFRNAGPEGQPTGPQNRAYDLRPRAGAANFDDSGWEVLDPTTLDRRRTAGKVAFNWYRFRLTVPNRIGEVDPTGATIVLDISIDDYAEIWVDGELSRRFGQRGGSVVAGWNAPNRLVVGRDVEPGQQIQLAIFGINGPISNAPTNYIYIRSARLELYPGLRGPIAVTPQEVNIRVERLSPALDAIVPANPKLFKLAEGFTFTEGPVWVGRDGGYLLFSDPNENVIYRYSVDGRLGVFRHPSGYHGENASAYHQPGSNGLTLDAEGRLVINEHGNRRISRLDGAGNTLVLADRYRGKRLNSPNDLVYRSDGSLYFTDPPFGLPKQHADPGKELPYSGVFRLANGELQLLTRELSGPNGIAFSPDEAFLYVGDWDPTHKAVMRYPVRGDGKLGKAEVFLDLTSEPGDMAIDGVKVDRLGNVYVSGPGGIWVVSAAGDRLGVIEPPRHAHNFAWGGPAARDLYITAGSVLYRMPLLVDGPTP